MIEFQSDVALTVFPALSRPKNNSLAPIKTKPIRKPLPFIFTPSPAIPVLCVRHSTLRDAKATVFPGGSLRIPLESLTPREGIRKNVLTLVGETWTGAILLDPLSAFARS